MIDIPQTSQVIVPILKEIEKYFENPVITLVIRADNVPNGSFIITRDNVTNPINALRVFRTEIQRQKMTLDDLVDLHKDLSTLEEFIGNILPEDISPDKLESIKENQKIIEKMIIVMKKNAIKHQFK